MQKQIELIGLQASVSIGIHEFELAAPQPYRLDIILGIETDSIPDNGGFFWLGQDELAHGAVPPNLPLEGYWVKNDDIAETVDYDILRERVLFFLQTEHFNLQETVVQKVMSLCFSLDPRVQWAEVRGSKPRVFADCDSVGLRYRATAREWRESMAAAGLS